MTTQPTPMPTGFTELNQIHAAVWLSQTLQTAIKLKIPEAFGDDARSSAAVALELGLEEGALYRLLRALAANGFFTEEPDRHFSHNAKSRVLLAGRKDSLRPMLEMTGLAAMQKAWDYLPEAMQDGRAAFVHAHGMELYAYLREDKHAATVFNEAMAMFSQPQAANIAARYTAFGHCQRALDVAGGLGHLLVAILQHYPGLQGGVFDLPQLQAPATQHLRLAGLSERAQFYPGTFLEKIPSGFDVYIIKNALWNWSDHDAGRILRNVRKAMGSEPSRLLIIEQLIQANNLAWTTLFDLQMLAVPGGRSRTEAEYRHLVDEAGMRPTTCHDLGDVQILECFPQ